MVGCVRMGSVHQAQVGRTRRQGGCSRDGREDRSAFAAPPREVSAAGTGASARTSSRLLAPARQVQQLANRPALPPFGCRCPPISREPPTARAERRCRCDGPPAWEREPC